VHPRSKEPWGWPWPHRDQEVQGLMWSRELPACPLWPPDIFSSAQRRGLERVPPNRHMIFLCRIFFRKEANGIEEGSFFISIGGQSSVIGRNKCHFVSPYPFVGHSSRRSNPR
jgi:hypothetical protein